MPSCIVQGCTSSSKTKDPAPVLHAFPPDVDSVRTWLRQTKQDFGNLEELIKKISDAPRGSFRMCSLHFGKECYEIRGRSFFLKRGAVPTIFIPKKVPGDMFSEEPCTSLKRSRSKRGPYVAFTDADVTAKDHNYAGTLPPPVQEVSSRQACDTSTMEVEIMPDSPTFTPYEETLPKFAKRKKVRLPPPSKLVDKVTVTPSGHHMHRGINTDPFFGTVNKKIFTNIRPKHFSVGIQCNIANLPALQDEMTRRQTIQSINTLALSSRSIRKMVLHRGRVFVDLGEEEFF